MSAGEEDRLSDLSNTLTTLEYRLVGISFSTNTSVYDMNVRLCQYDGTNVKLFVFQGSCSSETIRKLQFPLDKVQTTEICKNLHVAKIMGKYILLDISKISKLQNVLLQFSESVKIVAGQSVLLGLLRAQHAARVNELGLILARALSYTGENHTG